MSGIRLPKNYEIVSEEVSYDDGGFMDNSPKWLKVLAITGIVVGSVAVTVAASYGIYKGVGVLKNRMSTKKLCAGIAEDVALEKGKRFVGFGVPDRQIPETNEILNFIDGKI